MKQTTKLLVAALLFGQAVAMNAQKAERPLAPQGTQVVAHRGHWDVEGAAQNSRRSLQNACDLGLYGSEIDIWLTKDGHLFVNHDADYDGVTLQDATAEECRKLVLKNGEHMPELKDMLKIVKKSPSPTKLIIEVKECRTLAQNLASARATVKAVRKAGVRNKVEYISFSLAVCVEILRLDPEAQVAFLDGWRKDVGLTPEDLHKLGITGIDYHLSVFRNHPDWVAECHRLGMITNVWTVSDDDELREFRDMGIDFLTTNTPVDAQRICGE
ncbi:MAG: glycerophosphodiester phosphodiesterase [Prevotella sp.]|nr:glycerophosphodiester phosphodiesterase [Prevotella sp.]